jgi:hypothetical protein
MANKPENNKHGQSVLKSLEELENRRNRLLKLTKEMISAFEGKMYGVDIFAIGAVKRAISTAAGFRLLVESWNMICARALLRMQIDTALRFSSVFLVKKPHDFVLEVLKGRQINKLKDKDGNKMTDAYLVSKLATGYSWLPVVYKNLSGYVHLSEHHLFDSIEHINDESRTVSWAITEEDTKFPDFSWTEVVACFNESTDIFIKYLNGWIFTKENPEIVAKIKKLIKIN